MSETSDVSVKESEPIHIRAHRVLDTIMGDLRTRLDTIDGEMKRLSEEREYLGMALSRIAPNAPTPISGFSSSAGATAYQVNALRTSW